MFWHDGQVMRATKNRLLVVLGPTASGKTRLGVSLGRALDGEIISADSRQVYRGLDIGTGKDLVEYGQGAKRVPVHLIDVSEPARRYSVFDFQRDCFSAFEAITARGRLPIMVGGTGLFLSAVLDRYELTEVPVDPSRQAELDKLSTEELTRRLARLKLLHNSTDLVNRPTLIRALEIAEGSQGKPPPELPAFQALILGTRVDRPELHLRIRRRLEGRMEEGMLDEARRLREQGLALSRFDELGLEYRHLARLLQGQVDMATFLDELARDIRRFARKQLSWFRRMERQGHRIHWLSPEDSEQGQSLILDPSSWSA